MRPGSNSGSPATISVFRVEHLKRAPQHLREFTRSAPRSAVSSGLLPSNSAIIFRSFDEAFEHRLRVACAGMHAAMPRQILEVREGDQSVEIRGLNVCAGS